MSALLPAHGSADSPYASQTEGDIAVFPAFNYDAQLHCIGQ